MVDHEGDQVIAVWEQAGLTRSHNPPHRDLNFMIQTENSEVLVGELGGQICATVNVCHDGHRG